MAITRDRPQRSLTMSLALYVSDLIDRFASYMTELSKTYDTPFPEGRSLFPADCPAVDSPEHVDMRPFRAVYMSIVGGIMWIATMVDCTISFAVAQLARNLSNPSKLCWQSALRVLRYLQTHTSTLVFSPDVTRGLEVYIDSSWLSTYSCSGALFYYHGCLFAWYSKRSAQYRCPVQRPSTSPLCLPHGRSFSTERCLWNCRDKSAGQLSCSL